MSSYPQELDRFAICQRQIAQLVLYQSVLTDPVGSAWVNLIELLADSSNSPTKKLNCWQAYGKWFQALADRGLGWQEYLIERILKDENPFSRKSQHHAFQNLPDFLLDAARWDLQLLQNLYQIDLKCLSDRLLAMSAMTPDAIPIPANYRQRGAIYDKFACAQDWGTLVEDFAAYYRTWGTGIFAEFAALRWQRGQLIGIPHPDEVRISALSGYEWQKQQIIKNTEFLLAGYPALNILLYGSRGSGKSSLVKGLLNEYQARCLRLIEVNKSDLDDLPDIVERLRDLPHKFIIFVDDLSFEADDEAFKSLKVVLEGSVTPRPKNVVVYATSNRRHLVREFFADRPRPKDADEVQSWDTVQEKLSFSDRFGLTLTFEPADQNTYLEIVGHLATLAGIDLPLAELNELALRWATRHNGRSGRTAKQFIDFLRADLAQ